MQSSDIEDFVCEYDLASEKAVRVARKFVQAGRITLFQARQLLQGRWRNLIIADYCILHMLSQGGIGRVFLADKLPTKERFVIKVLRERQRCKPEAAERFRLEAFACLELDHPNLVRGREYAAIDDSEHPIHYLAMDLVKGPNLHEFYAMRKRLPWRQACEVIRQIGVGLDEVHRREFVHRDVKPPNILLAPGGVAKLIDFGLACYHGDEQQFDIPTDRRVGTEGFIAPEQLSRGDDADRRADVYGLGCSLYFALTARLPKTKKDSKRRTLPVELEPLATIDPEIPSEVEVILQKMTARKPDGRFDNMSQVIESLDPFCEPFSTDINFHALLRARERSRSKGKEVSKPSADMSTVAANSPEAPTKPEQPLEISASVKSAESGGFSEDLDVSEFEDRSDLVDTIESLTQRLESSQQQNERAQTELSDLQVKLRSAESSLSEQITALTAQVHSAEQWKATAEARHVAGIKSLQDQVTKLDIDRQRIEASYASTVEQLKSALQEARDERAAIERSHEEEVGRLQGEVDVQLQANTTAAASHAKAIQELQSELDTLKKNRDTSQQSHESEVRQLASQINDAEVARGRERERDEERRAAYAADLRQLRTETDELSQRLSSQCERHANITTQWKEHDQATAERVKLLRSEIASLSEQVDRWKEETKKARAERDAERQKRELAAQSRTTVEQTLATRDHELVDLKKRLEIAEQRQATENRERESLAESFANVQAELRTAQSRISELETQSLNDSPVLLPPEDKEDASRREQWEAEVQYCREQINEIVDELNAMSGRARELAKDINQPPPTEDDDASA